MVLSLPKGIAVSEYAQAGWHIIFKKIVLKNDHPENLYYHSRLLP